MARKTKTKKITETPKVDIGAEVFSALRDLEKHKGIPVSYMTERIKQALVNAYRKDREERMDTLAENVEAEVSEDGLCIFQIMTVVDKLENPAQEVPLDAARRVDHHAELGQSIRIPVDISKFSRIAAQTAKQVIIQGIREAERGTAYESRATGTEELVNGTVTRIENNGDMVVRIFQNDKAFNSVLRLREQNPVEKYTIGDPIRVYILSARQERENTMIYVSRTHPNLVRRLFELETPEIANGQVEIRNIVREPGSRSKMSVRATIEGLDPVGACVGVFGGRVRSIVDELRGEKIDIVTWSEDPCSYISSALNPAEVTSVNLIPNQKACRVVVPDDQLTLAIGKGGQNARMAARLTGYKIDLVSESQVEYESFEDLL